MMNQKRLKSQKDTVKLLDQRIRNYRKNNNHIIVQRQYQYQKFAQGNTQPIDELNNGGFKQDYQLLKSPHEHLQLHDYGPGPDFQE